MEPINNFQVGNYIQYPVQVTNNGQITMVLDRIFSIDKKQIKTEKGLTCTIEQANSQFFPVSILPEWLSRIGFKKYCEKNIFSLWENTLNYSEQNKPITILIIEHNDNKSFFLGFVNEPLYAHSLQNLIFNITGERIDLPITL